MGFKTKNQLITDMGLGYALRNLIDTLYTGAVSVQAFGATGDGVTDDTIAIQAAIDAANTAGGGVVLLPPGTYMASFLTLKSNVLLDGGYFRNVTLKQIAASNRDFIVSENFATLTGSDSAAPTDPDVPTWFGLKDIFIDGNKANQTSGNGVSFYGSQMVMLGTVYVKDCKENCIYTEGPDSAQASLADVDGFEGGYFDDIICHFAGVYGWEFVGPHNSQIKSYRAILDDDGTSSYGWYSHNNGTASSGVLDHIGHMHVYSFSANTTNRRGYWFAGGAAHVDNLLADAVNILIDPPSGIETGFPSFGKIKLTNVGRNPTNLVGLEINDDAVKIDDLEVATSTAATGSAVGVQLDNDYIMIGRLRLVDASTAANNIGLDQNGDWNQIAQIYAEGFSGTSSIGLDMAGRENIINGLVENCTTGLNYAGVTNNKMNLHIDAGAAQTHVTGTPTVNDQLAIKGGGAAGILYTERSLQSDTFAIDSTGVKTVTVAHGALFTPAVRQVQATPVLSTAIDWVGTVDVQSVDATNINLRVNVSTASATGSATSRLAVKYDVRGS